MRNSELRFLRRSVAMDSGAGIAALDKAPLAGSLMAGLAASLCCGGGLLFGAVGLGAVYSALGMARYIPEALAGGAMAIALLNWLYYRRKTALTPAEDADYDHVAVRRAMLVSGFLGLALMATSFVLLEWLNHAVVNAARFMQRPELAEALIRGVPNSHLSYIAMTFLVLPVLAILPMPRNARPAKIGGLSI